MSSCIDWAPRRAIAVALSAVLTLALGLSAAAAAPSGGAAADLQLAQAAPPPQSGAPGEQFAQLKTRLAITPAQQPQFAAFVLVMQGNAAARSAFVRRNPPGRTRNALDQLRIQAEAAQLDARGLQRLLPVFQSLYAALSPQQKQAADQLFAPPAAASR